MNDVIMRRGCSAARRRRNVVLRSVGSMLLIGLAALLGRVPLSAQDVAAPAKVAPSAGPMAPAGGPVVIGPDGKPVLPGGRPGGSPGDPGQPGGAAKPDDKKDAGPKAVTRPEKPPLPPDPRELKVEPNPEGKVRFRFHGQSWGDVLEWLARVSGMSLDWQELPGDYLNLVTQREYSVPEARDLINRHLLARGFTLLEQGEILSVVNIQKLNPGMVPRVEPSELATRMPHEYVKVSFALDWLLSEKAVEELKPMLSPNAKITPLKTTNRIEAVDAVVNLREVFALLQREQSSDGDQRLVREFVLQHTRATEVLPQLQDLLGMDSKPAGRGRTGPADPMEMMQQQQMMMMQMQRQGGNQPPPQPKKNEDVHLIANARKNSVLANAPPDKMEIIAQAVKAIDVESDRTDSLLANVNRIQVYRLHTVDPEALVRTLMDIGEMDPATRLEVDTKNKSIIAYATLADHLTIRQVLERLDGSTRKFEVISLRRLEADYVAGTIEFMMTGPKDEKPQPRYYDYYYSPFRRNESSDKTDDKFRVDADVQNNRLLLWANEVEIGEVTNLLVKLGEIPAEGGRRERIRVLESIPPEETERFLERLRRAWPSLAPNPLQLPDVPSGSGGATPAPHAAPETRPDGIPLDAARQRTKEARRGRGLRGSADEAFPVQPSSPRAESAGAPRWALAQLDPRPADAPPAEPPRQERSRGGSRRKEPDDTLQRPAPAPPPVDITLAPDGRVVISSDDTRALDLLEELIGQLAPPRRDFRVFRLKHADAYWVAKNLEEFFETDEQEKPRSSRFVYYYDYYSPQNRGDTPSYRLSQRRKLKFIDDLDTNSILVQGADSDQIRIIEDLIATYDQAQQADASSARLTAVFPIRYSKAQVIAEAVKDVYRDLLSSNDKALQNNNGNPEQRNRPSAGTTYIFNEGGDTGDEKERTRVSFKGKLSLGVDELTNTLLVSAEGEILMRNVTEMVKSMDEAARPLSAVSVLPVSGSTNAAHVRDVLTRILVEPKTPAAGEKPGQRPTPPTGPQQPDASPAAAVSKM